MDTAQVLAYLHAQRDRIVNAIAALEAMGWTAAAKLTNQHHYQSRYTCCGEMRKGHPSGFSRRHQASHQS